MNSSNLRQVASVFFLAAVLTSTGCQTSNTPVASTSAPDSRNLAPQRVDIRGSIIVRHYDKGQVMLEVEGLTSPNSRFSRAYVLVTPTTQLVGTDGTSISLSELQLGQQVAVLLRGSGKGNMVGMGVARKLWVEELM